MQSHELYKTQLMVLHEQFSNILEDKQKLLNFKNKPPVLQNGIRARGLQVLSIKTAIVM